MLADRTVSALLLYVPFMLAQGGVASVLPSALRPLWTVMVVYYSLTRIPFIFHDWLAVRWSADEAGLAWRKGLISSEETRVAWSQIVSLTSHQTYLGRLLRIHRLRAVVGAEARDALQLDALSTTDCARLFALHNPNGEVHPVEASTVDAHDDGGHEVYRFRPRDSVSIGLTHGMFLLFIPFVLGAGGDVAEFLGITEARVSGLLRTWGMLPVCVIAAAAAVAYGTAHAWLSYHGYTVRRYAWGYRCDGGLFRRTRRDARLEDVVGLRIEQNLLMQTHRRCSVHLILARGRGSTTSLPVLPLVRVQDVDEHLRVLMPGACAPQAFRRSWLEPVSVCVMGACAAILASVQVSPWVGVVVGLLAAALAHGSCAAVALSGSALWIRTGLWGSTTRIVATGAVHSAWFGRRQVPAPAPRGLLALRLLDRRPLLLWAPGVPTPLAEEITGRICPCV